MTTIYDVAKKAGVSPATVSRVLNNKDNVKPETRDLIKKTCKELNYIMNTNAGSLKKNRTQSLAILIPSISNPFFISVLEGFEKNNNDNGYNTIICNSDKNYDHEVDYIQMLLEKRIDGIAISTVSKNYEHIKQIINKKVPLILIDRKINDLNVDVICGDNYNGTIELIDHLISLGHKNIAIITGPLHLSTSSERLSGYKKALKNSDLSIKENLIKIEQSEDYSKEKAYYMTKELLNSDSEFSAIFVTNNTMALGVYKALKEEKIKIPEDKSVVCFDDFGSVIDPFFTVMKQPATTIGKIASDVLIKRTEKKLEKNIQQIELKPELVIRKSSGKIRHNK